MSGWVTEDLTGGLLKLYSVFLRRKDMFLVSRDF